MRSTNRALTTNLLGLIYLSSLLILSHLPQPTRSAPVFTHSDDLRRKTRAAPLVEIPVRVDGTSRQIFRLYAGDNIRTATANFIEAHNLEPGILDGLVAEVRKRVINVSSVSLQHAADVKKKQAALKAAEEGRGGLPGSGTNSGTQSSVAAYDDNSYTMDLTMTVPLVHTIGDSSAESVRQFCVRHGLDHDQYADALLAALNQKVANASKRADSPVHTITTSIGQSHHQRRRASDALLTLDIEVDGVVQVLRHFDGDTMQDTAAAFCAMHALGEEAIPLILNEIQKAAQQKGRD